MDASFDLITTGRVGVDLYPNQIGVPLAEVTSFSKFLGGSPTNVAVQAARLGSRAAVVTKVGPDGFGTFVRDALTRFGVDNTWVGTDPDLLTPVVFCEIHPPDHFPLLFYRLPTAPDMNLSVSDFDVDTVCRAKLFWITGTGLSGEPSRSTLLALLRERKQRYPDATTILDLDYRPMFWRSPADAHEAIGEALGLVTIAIGNLDEVEVAVGERDPTSAAAALLERGVEIAIVKRGPDGVLATTSHERVEVAPVRLPVVNGLGAGDAFGGAFCHGLVTGQPLPEALRLANAAGAFAASRLACADDFATPDELAALMNDSPHAHARAESMVGDEHA
jgi:5-dehydro-2-deoxygluconokinase